MNEAQQVEEDTENERGCGLSCGLLIIIVFAIFYMISVFFPSDYCIEDGRCIENSKIGIGPYFFIINEKSCEIVNGTWNEISCDIWEKNNSCRRLWDPINKRCSEVLPDEIAFNSDVISRINIKYVSDFLEKQKDNPDYTHPSYDKQRNYPIPANMDADEWVKTSQPKQEKLL